MDILRPDVTWPGTLTCHHFLLMCLSRNNWRNVSARGLKLSHMQGAAIPKRFEQFLDIFDFHTGRGEPHPVFSKNRIKCLANVLETWNFNTVRVDMFYNSCQNFMAVPHQHAELLTIKRGRHVTHTATAIRDTRSYMIPPFPCPARLSDLPPYVSCLAC